MDGIQSAAGPCLFAILLEGSSQAPFSGHQCSEWICVNQRYSVTASRCRQRLQMSADVASINEPFVFPVHQEDRLPLSNFTTCTLCYLLRQISTVSTVIEFSMIEEARKSRAISSTDSQGLLGLYVKLGDRSFIVSIKRQNSELTAWAKSLPIDQI